MGDQAVADGANEGEQLGDGLALKSHQGPAHQLEEHICGELLTVGWSEDVREATPRGGLHAPMGVLRERHVEAACLGSVSVAQELVQCFTNVGVSLHDSKPVVDAEGLVGILGAGPGTRVTRL